MKSLVGRVLVQGEGARTTLIESFSGQEEVT